MDDGTEVTLIATMVVKDGTDYGISGKISKNQLIRWLYYLKK